MGHLLSSFWISSIFYVYESISKETKTNQTDAMVCWPDTHLIDVNSEENSENSPCEDKVWVINRQTYEDCVWLKMNI